MSSYKVAYFVGSLSSTSIRRVLSRALIRLAPQALEFTELPIGNLPLYSPDSGGYYPAEPHALGFSRSYPARRTRRGRAHRWIR